MKASIAAASITALLMAAPAFAANSSNSSGPPHLGNLSTQDEQFLIQAGPGNLGEVELGKLAAQKGGTPAIREFGKWMESSHWFANKELTTITEKMNNEAPRTGLTPEEKSEMRKLQGLSGQQFDQEYLQTMVQDHQKDLKEFKKEAQNGQDALIKTYAQNLVPVLEQHLEEAQTLMKMTSQSGNESGNQSGNQ